VFRENGWIDEVGSGQTTISILVRQPEAQNLRPGPVARTLVIEEPLWIYRKAFADPELAISLKSNWHSLCANQSEKIRLSTHGQNRRVLP
jgi:hypothetical protein